MQNAMIINPTDNVIVAIREISQGEVVEYSCGSEIIRFPVQENITIYHKIACRDIAAGSPVYKYGECIGIAECDIKKGAHVHTHNLDSH